MLKSSAHPFLFALMASATLAACGAPSTSVSTKPLDFGMTVADQQTLDAVGCKIVSSKIVCEDPVYDNKQSKIDNLNHKQKVAADRKVAIDKVEASIRAALKRQKFSPKGKLDPQALDESLIAESATQQTKAKSFEKESGLEQDYLTILGYHCEASHDQKGSSISSAGDILLATPQPIVIKDEASSFVALIGLQAPSNQITYSLSDKEDPSSQKSLAVIQTDAEFILRTSDTANSSVNCSHLRKAGSAMPFSDRVADLTTCDCVIKTTTANVPSTRSISIPVSADTESEVLPAFDLTSKYALHTAASKGILTVVVSNSSNTTVAQASIPNSAKSLSLLIDSKDGNSISLKCAAHK